MGQIKNIKLHIVTDIKAVAQRWIDTTTFTPIVMNMAQMIFVNELIAVTGGTTNFMATVVPVVPLSGNPLRGILTKKLVMERLLLFGHSLGTNGGRTSTMTIMGNTAHIRSVGIRAQPGSLQGERKNLKKAILKMTFLKMKL